MFTHTTSLYDILGQPPTHIRSPPSSCHLFSERDIRTTSRAMSTNGAADGEGLQANSLHMASVPLTHILLIYLTMCYVQVSPIPGLDTSFTLSTNQGIVLIQTITGLLWWDIPSPNFMPRLYINSSLTIWKVAISELNNRQASAQITRRPITFSH